MSGQELKVEGVVSRFYDNLGRWSAEQITGKHSRQFETLHSFCDYDREGDQWVHGIHPTLRDPELVRMAAEIEALKANELELLRQSAQDSKHINSVDDVYRLLGLGICTDGKEKCLAEIKRLLDVEKQLDAANAEVARLTADSVRYNWLKKHARKIEWRTSDETQWLTSRPELDGDIDAAIARQSALKITDHLDTRSANAFAAPSPVQEWVNDPVVDDPWAGILENRTAPTPDTKE